MKLSELFTAKEDFIFNLWRAELHIKTELDQIFINQIKSLYYKDAREDFNSVEISLDQFERLINLAEDN